MDPDRTAARNILVVDDNATNRKLLTVTLQAEGFSVIEAADGVDALALLGQQEVDVIVSDILMPRMDGYRLCSEVRKNEKLRHLPFIMYTSTYTSPSDEKLALRVGVDKYLRKPAPTRVIVETIGEACGQPSPKRAGALEEPEVMKEYNEALVKKLEDTNAVLARAVARQECLAGLSQTALARIDAATVMDEAVHAVAQNLDVDYCGCWERLPDGDGLLFRAGTGWKDGLVGSVTVSGSATDSQAAYTLRSDEPVVVERLGAEQRFRADALLSQHRVASGISVAIHGPQGAVGVLSAHTSIPRTFRAEEILFLQSTANIVATAIRRARAEEGLRTAVDELSAARISAERAKAAAEAANAAKDRFLAVLSHELRTPLAPVLTAVSMLLRQSWLDRNTSETLELVRRNVELEARLIDDLLDFTRITRGKVELHKRTVELCTIIHRAVEVCRPDIEARQLHFGVDLGPGPYLVEADIARLQQVFWNLLKNAIKFTPHGGCVGIRCQPDGSGHVAVEVNDSGLGIEPDALTRIFDAFEQAERSITRQFGGLGLGLAISKSLVEMHGGTIEAFSEGKGKGATFRLRLPILDDASRQPIAGTQAEDVPGSRARSLTLLIVEDHGDTAQMIRVLLEFEGHRVHTAGDVATALDVLARERFDVLISDLGLPDGSGLELMRELRARGLALPAIALSGFGQEQDVEQSRQAGFAAHMIKPVDTDDLLATLARVAALAR